MNHRSLNTAKALKPRISRNQTWPALWSIRLFVGNVVLLAGGLTPLEAYERLMSSPIVHRRRD